VTFLAYLIIDGGGLLVGLAFVALSLAAPIKGTGRVRMSHTALDQLGAQYLRRSPQRLTSTRAINRAGEL
jgi:hypothetical protein